MASAYFDAREGGEVVGGRRGRPRRASPDTRTARTAQDLRERARCLEETYDLAESILATFVKAIVGAEVIFEPQVMGADGALHEDFNNDLRHWFKVWARRPEVTGEYDYHEGCRQHLRSALRDGEMFQQYVEGYIPSLEHGSDVPLSLEHIEADFCPLHFSAPERRITQSVEKNAWGRAIAYHMLKHHPGDAHALRSGSPDKRVSSDVMLHHKYVTHFRQTRGLSIFAPIVSRFADIQDIEESERIAARCAAAMVGFRTRGAEEDWSKDDGDDEIGFEPGAFYELNHDQSVEVSRSNRPNNALIPFMEEQMRRLSGGSGANFSSLSRNYNGTYSSQRQELVEGYVGYGVMHADLANSKLYPDWRRLVDTLVRFRLITVPADVDIATLHDVDIPRPPMPWIDPKKEADGYQTLVDAELESPTHVMRMRGRNPVIVRAQIEGDRKWRQPAPKPVAAPGETTDEDVR